ncbi:hypothetical protein CO669_18635 [Bradyrhizobium sp. Y36]|uniref:hypothetical protein n=1 Tax=Bradyrhizobium sp. Y36 TaxID=2035447 RepID=UPI000BEA63ED|nr:hypothetical protein [Bradyrhizobium sp. Y36]PDT88779.1 hypothetical protein CO669_18635 [Bradyrhizobium sp. Y36]
MTINIADRRRTKSPVTHQDRKLKVSGREYTVRRSAWEGRAIGGWISVRDDKDEPLFVRGGDLPDAMIAELIAAWSDGYNVGRREAARAAARRYTGDIV